MRFVHLHNHSMFSLLDASSKIEPMVKRVKELDMPAIALTDHGTMSGSVQLWSACKKEGVTPIIGCELYVSVGDHRERKRIKGQKHYTHLVVFALNETGYKNLCKLVSEGYLNGFYYKPRVSKEFLAKHTEGLFCTSACMVSSIAQCLLTKNNPDEDIAIARARKEVDDYYAMFGDRFRLELQDHGIKEQFQLNMRMMRLAEETGIPLVFTNDCHFIGEEDFEPHKGLKCIQGGENIHTAYHVYKPDHRIKSAEEMGAIVKNYPEEYRERMYAALTETADIAEMVDFDFTTGKYFFPEMDVENVDQEFRRLCLSGFEERSKMFLPGRGEEYAQRLMYEMELISRMGFESYFLILADVVRFCREKGIPVGPGRGSAAGSIVSYCLGITALDPLAHKLLFERFLNPARISMPDIDMDFSKRRRHEVIDYTVEKYGRDNVAQIVTFGTLKARAALKDMARVHGWSVPDQNRLSSLVPQTPGKSFTLERALEEIPEVAQAISDPDSKKVWDMAVALEDTARHAGIHAAGVVITPEPVSSYAPLFKPAGDNQDIAAAYDMRDLEKIGLVKMDYLGLKTLDVVYDCIALTGEDIDIDNIPLDESEIYEKVFASGNTKGVFQFESPGMRQALKRLGPTCFDDIVALNALYRPGPMDAKIDGKSLMEMYIDRKNGRDRAVPFHPDVADIVDKTYGVLVFQEQVMESVRRLAGYSLGEADVIRKAMGKKDPKLMKEQLEKFVAGGVAKGRPKQEMKDVAELIRTFARYGFNRAHAAAYSFIAYQTAWVKFYYPTEFMAALLTSEAEDNKPENVQDYIGDAKRMGLEVLPPDVNYSQEFFTIERIPCVYDVDSQQQAPGEEDAIRFGLAAIKHVGVDVARSIIAEREANGKFQSLPDFLDRMKLNKRVIEYLIFAGATGSLGGHPAEHYANFEQLIERRKKVKDDGSQMSLLKLAGEHHMVIEQNMEFAEEWDTKTLAAYEKEALGLWLQHHPLNPHADKVMDTLSEIREAETRNARVICVITKVMHRRSQAHGKPFAIVTLEDLSGSMDVMVWDDKVERFREHMLVDNIVWVHGNTRRRQDRMGFSAQLIQSVEVDDAAEESA